MEDAARRARAHRAKAAEQDAEASREAEQAASIWREQVVAALIEFALLGREADVAGRYPRKRGLAQAWRPTIGVGFRARSVDISLRSEGRFSGQWWYVSLFERTTDNRHDGYVYAMFPVDADREAVRVAVANAEREAASSYGFIRKDAVALGEALGEVVADWGGAG